MCNQWQPYELHVLYPEAIGKYLLSNLFLKVGRSFDREKGGGISMVVFL